jgi:hypothetical protein
MQIIYRTHNSEAGGHPGRMKTTELVSRSYFWPKMTHDIQNYIKGRILIREDGEEEIVEKWEFDLILDTHNEDEHHYLI